MSMSFASALNNYFLLVFTPKENKNIYPNKRFLISINQLHNYVGRQNSNKAIETAFNSKEYKITIKLRKYGKLEFYSK